MHWLGLPLLLASASFAGSEASYPSDWRSWVLVKETVIPSADTPIPDGVPPLFVDTIKSYNWVNDGKGTRLDIYVNPRALEAYKTHGPYADGPTAVGVFADVGIVFVTEHLLGRPVYGSYDVHGKDLSDTNPSFSSQVCRNCHTGYSEICKGGTCALPMDPLPTPRQGQ